MRGQIKSTSGKKKLDKLKIQIQVEKTFGDHFSSDIMLSALLDISHYQKSFQWYSHGSTFCRYLQRKTNTTVLVNLELERVVGVENFTLMTHKDIQSIFSVLYFW